MESFNTSHITLHTNSLISLLSILSLRFNTKAFTLCTDPLPFNNLFHFYKLASQNRLLFNFQPPTTNLIHQQKAFLVMSRDSTILQKVLATRPKLVVAVFFSGNIDSVLEENMMSLTVPLVTSFFWTQLKYKPEIGVVGQCWGVFRPLITMSPRMFNVLYLKEEGEEMIWIENSSETVWDYYGNKIFRNLSEVEVKIGVDVSYGMVFKKLTTIPLWKAFQDYSQVRLKLIPLPDHLYMNFLLTGKLDSISVFNLLTSDLAKVVDFSTFGKDLKMNLIIKAPQFEYSWDSILKPFTFEVWISFFFLLLLISIVLGIINSSTGSSSGLMDSMLLIFGFTCCQGSDDIRRKRLPWFVSMLGLLFTLFVFQYYLSDFHSALIARDAKLPFTSLQDFISKRTHSLLIDPEFSAYSEIKRAKYGILKDLWDGFMRDDPNHQVTSVTMVKGLKRVCNGEAASLGFTVDLPAELRICRFYAVQPGIFGRPLVIVTGKHFAHTRHLRALLQKVFEAGFSRTGTDRGRNEYALPNESILEPVTLLQVELIIFFFISIAFLSLVIFCLELLWYRRQRRRQK